MAYPDGEVCMVFYQCILLITWGEMVTLFICVLGLSFLYPWANALPLCCLGCICRFEVSFTSAAGRVHMHVLG